MPFLLGLTTEEIARAVAEMGGPAYRGKQIAAWIYRRGAASVEEMTDLPRALREKLAQEWQTGVPSEVARDAAPDGTVKYVLGLPGGNSVESVYLPYTHRVSACLSTQVGCAAGCAFCATGKEGFLRNLSPGEIVGQLLHMQAKSERRIDHAVYMGMGEPLWNYDNVIRSVHLLHDEVGMSVRNLTISTVGVVPGILALAKENLPVTLALSLHAPDDQLRAQLIPTGRKWPIAEILDACAEYARVTGRNLTFEYLMLGGLNDSPEQARRLAFLLKQRDLPGNVNLIPFNYVETKEGFKRPTRESIERFREELEGAGRVTTQRMTRGNTISAACGQLRQLAVATGEAPAIASSSALPVA